MVSRSELRQIAQTIRESKDAIMEFATYIINDTKILQEKARRGKYKKNIRFEHSHCGEHIDEKYANIVDWCSNLHFKDLTGIKINDIDVELVFLSRSPDVLLVRFSWE